jgi:hypothetical protein
MAENTFDPKNTAKKVILRFWAKEWSFFMRILSKPVMDFSAYLMGR